MLEISTEMNDFVEMQEKVHCIAARKSFKLLVCLELLENQLSSGVNVRDAEHRQIVRYIHVLLCGFSWGKPHGRRTTQITIYKMDTYDSDFFWNRKW